MPGQGAEISGTSEIVGLMSATPGSADGVISFPPVRGLATCTPEATQAGGDALRWIAGVLGMSISEALAAAAAVDPQPLVFLPHLAGERAPLWNADARAVFLGMTSHTTPGHLVRAVLEGVAHAARHLRESCEQAAGFRAETLRLSGGGRRQRAVEPDPRRRPPLRPRAGGQHDDGLPRRRLDGRCRRWRCRQTSSRGPPTS